MARPVKWRPLLTWTFKGDRFEEDGIDLRDLDELVRLRTILVDLAKAEWRRDHPTRERLPARAEESLALRFFQTKKGSCVVPIYYAVPTVHQADLFSGDVDEESLAAKLPSAARAFAESLRSLRDGSGFVVSLPPEIVPRIAELGGSLEANEYVEVEVAEDDERAIEPGALATAGEVLVLNAALRAEVVRIMSLVIPTRQTVEGEVTMASIKGRATLRVEGRDVALEFGAAHEEEITRALHEHERLRVRVRGLAERDARGDLKKIAIDELRVVEGDRETEEARLTRLALTSPNEVFNMVAAPGVRPVTLTHAAEIIGLHLRADPRSLKALAGLLAHESALVREGAVYGLVHHGGAGPEVIAVLRQMSTSDLSPGVRAAAVAALEEVE